ncbi:MAG: M23 family metallopeptidase [Betaproteobacteria bacterium]|jgi:murein DD-endopeptidase MepM/ murein hydrolase activator NlpD|nr:M23 family metallopeptidase [Betaproteobacteria bacterium]NBS92566.1 M23 family metallopeptidase [Betaproteobacteria bacterium]NBT06304.1 M23 family metallopeptidase [Betaproteobacteria bacterium]NBU12220.1 M23 family metallopeptidase [Betaproteobacteria bacterium]NBY52573.1 M23 family metallopeptidase [Betaproteobacteria bacterium]
MQLILVTHAGRRTRSVHLRAWHLSVVVGLVLSLLFGGTVLAALASASNLTVLQRAVDIWDGTRSDVMAGKLGELSARIDSLEAALDVKPHAGTDAGSFQRQRFAPGSREREQRAVLDNLERRAGDLQAALDRQLVLRETTLRSVLRQALEVPVDGHLSSGFGWRTHPVLGEPAFHRGIDLSAPAGTPVHASTEGVVSFIGPADSYGKLVVISHGTRMQSRYAHLQGIEVTTGMAVSAGQRIGRVGSTGRSTGPHLHFELVIDGRVVNPQNFLGKGEALRRDAAAA